MRFSIALPGKDVYRGKVTDMVIDSRYPSPKIDTTAKPPHAGIVFVNWSSSISLASGDSRLIYSFPHNYNNIPTVMASYEFDNGSARLKGTLPFQYGGLGIITIDADNKNINIKYYSTDFAATVIPAFTMKIRFYVMSEQGK